MKNEIIIALISIILVLSVSFFIFNIQENSITGFVSNDGNQTGNDTIITEEMASSAIQDCNEIIKEMEAEKFSVIYMNDTLTEANRIFEQAKYAEILRNENASAEDKLKARAALSLIDWRSIDYSDVLIYTDKIKARKTQAFTIYDSMNALNESIIKYKQEGIEVNDSEQLLKNLNTAFYEDRYNDCESLLIELRNLIEDKKTQISIFTELGRGGKTFFQKNWLYLLVSITALSLGGFFSYKKISRKILREKIRKLKSQERVLSDLMIKCQTDRFKENKISGVIYNAKMKKYQEKLNEIKEKLPVLESKLK
jgi:hypothetical protein